MKTAACLAVSTLILALVAFAAPETETEKPSQDKVTEAYRDGYRHAYSDAYREAYREGHRDGYKLGYEEGAKKSR